MRSVAMIAYARVEDRERLDILARAAGQTKSAWVVERIRETFRSSFGPNISAAEVRKLLNWDDNASYRARGNDGRRYRKKPKGASH